MFVMFILFILDNLSVFVVSQRTESPQKCLCAGIKLDGINMEHTMEKQWGYPGIKLQ